MFSQTTLYNPRWRTLTISSDQFHDPTPINSRTMQQISPSPTETSLLLPNKSSSPGPTPNHPYPIDTKNIPRPRLVTIILLTWIGSFLAAIDSTITSTLALAISSSFPATSSSSPSSLIPTLASAYLIALTVVQPLSGKVTDIFGRRSGFLWCLFLFALGNGVSAIAKEAWVVVMGRVFAGLGGGGLNSISTFLGTDLVPLRNRGIVQGVGMVTYGVGIGLGGAVGGAIGETWGWRWAFGILVPITALLWIVGWIIVPGMEVLTFQQLESRGLSHHRSQFWHRVKRVDFIGSALLTLGLGILLWSLNYDSAPDTTSPFPTTNTHSALLALTLPLSVLTLLLFLLYESRFATEPIIPPSLLFTTDRTVPLAGLTACFVSMSTYILTFYVPLYFAVRGNSPHEIGIRLLPESVGTALGSLGTGLVTRKVRGYGVTKLVALSVFLAGAVGFAVAAGGPVGSAVITAGGDGGLDGSTSLIPESAATTAATATTKIWLEELFLFLKGLGFGGMLTTMLLATLSAVRKSDGALVTGMMYAFRSTGATVGVAVAGWVFQAVLRAETVGMPMFEGGDDDVGTEVVSGGMRWGYSSERAASVVEGMSGAGWMAQLCHTTTPAAVRWGRKGEMVCEIEMAGAYLAALRGVFLLAVGFAGLGLLCGAFTRNFALGAVEEKVGREEEGGREGEGV